MAGEARFAAVWEKGPGPVGVARHGLSGDEYQKAFDRYARAGYRPVAISAYNDGGRTRMR